MRSAWLQLQVVSITILVSRPQRAAFPDSDFDGTSLTAQRVSIQCIAMPRHLVAILFSSLRFSSLRPSPLPSLRPSRIHLTSALDSQSLPPHPAGRLTSRLVSSRPLSLSLTPRALRSSRAPSLQYESFRFFSFLFFPFLSVPLCFVPVFWACLASPFASNEV